MMAYMHRQPRWVSAILTASWTPPKKINNRHGVNNIHMTTGSHVSHLGISSHRMAETSGQFQISDFQKLWCCSTSWDLISRRVTTQSNPNKADSLRPCQALSWLIINRTPYPAATGRKWGSEKKKEKKEQTNCNGLYHCRLLHKSRVASQNETVWKWNGKVCFLYFLVDNVSFSTIQDILYRSISLYSYLVGESSRQLMKYIESCNC